MNIKFYFKKYGSVVISYAFILLFVYAAVSKWIDFENFQVQLGQSPMLGAYAEWIAWIIPLSEILIAVALSFSKFREVALFASYALMVMFTAYIYIILNYSDFIPCSCGGVLEKMSWNEHLIFNMFFIFLAMIAIFIERQPHTNNRKTSIYMLLVTVGSSILVIALFLASENKIHHKNPFTRRIPHSPVKVLQGISLEHNSYYIAGYANGKIYLGNNSAPKHILQIDTSLTHQKAFRLNQDNHHFNFNTAQVRIKDKHYYFADGTIPVIYRGSIKDWKGKPIYNGTTKFSTYEVVDTAKFVVRAIKPKTGENVMAFIDSYKDATVVSETDILEKRLDGIFDTDGLLSYNMHNNTSLYTYYYRNQYVIMKPTLDSFVRGKTIDTLHQVDLQFAYTRQGREKKFATQPEKINTYAATSGKYLYIKSKRLGKYDRPEMLQQASLIDVYRIEDNSYQFSFYFYHHKGEEIKSFKIYDDIIVGTTNKYLVVGRFRKERFNPLE